MAYEQAFADICAQINATFEVRQLVKYAGGNPDKIVKSGDVFLALCPIHGEQLFRTLVLNPRNNTYHCRHVNCPGNQVSDYLDLLVKVQGVSLAEVVRSLVEAFGADYFRLNERQVDIVQRKCGEPGAAEPSAVEPGAEG